MASNLIDPGELDEPAAYRLMTGIVVPRPIAWITTLNPDRSVNLAPFSCYTFIASDPVLVGVAIGRRGAEEKDTLRNLRRTGTFVVNIPAADQAELVHRSAVEFPAGVSEVDLLELHTRASAIVDVPRLADVPVALECVLVEANEYGNARTTFTVGRVDRIHVRDGLLVDGKIDTDALRPLGRVAGPAYAPVGPIERFAPIPHTMYQPENGAVGR